MTSLSCADNTIYLWTSGPEEAVLQVQLNPKAGIRVADLEERLRQKLSQELPGVRYSFEPSDIVNQVMSFVGGDTEDHIVVFDPLGLFHAHCLKPFIL